jgi:hypothetical protein
MKTTKDVQIFLIRYFVKRKKERKKEKGLIYVVCKNERKKRGRILGLFGIIHLHSLLKKSLNDYITLIYLVD